MACIVIRKGAKCWSARYRYGGREFVKSLDVIIEDRDKYEQGEETEAFLGSKNEAEDKLGVLLAGLESTNSDAQILEAVYQARSKGRTVKAYHIDQLSSTWKSIKRSKKPSQKYLRQCSGWIDAFSAYMRKHYPHALTLDHLGEEHAEEYMTRLEQSGISPKTYNDILKTLRTITKRARNPIFENIPHKQSETINRVPYDPDELSNILDMSRHDQFIYPIVVTALCSAMRLGDCCCLRWDAVDLANGFLSVKTAKTGATVDIPIFHLLYEVLNERKDNGSTYVFPSQRDQYLADQTLFTRRLRSVLARAGFYDPAQKPQRVIDDYDPEELRLKAVEYSETVPTCLKRERMLTVLDLYLKGDTLPKIAQDLDIGKGTVSAYLNEMQTAVGIHFIRGGKGRVVTPSVPNVGRIRQERPSGLKKASLRDWHSFRTTWITLALSSGMPFELVSMVTGHTTANVVMKHYFQPQREALKKSIQAHMPKMLTSGAGSTQDKVIELLEGATAGNWKARIKEAVLLIKKAGV